MRSSLIEVVYTDGRTACPLGETRWLDPVTGTLYGDEEGMKVYGKDYEEESAGVYSNWFGTVAARPSQSRPKIEPEQKGQAGGLKFDAGKPRWSLLTQGCHAALDGVAKVLTFGAAKYSAHSWKQVENNTERYRDALYRHLNAIESGEILDPESGLPHWDHVCCNALFLSQLAKEKA